MGLGLGVGVGVGWEDLASNSSSPRGLRTKKKLQFKKHFGMFTAAAQSRRLPGSHPPLRGGEKWRQQ